MRKTVALLLLAMLAASLAWAAVAHASPELIQCEPVTKGAGLFGDAACVVPGSKFNHEALTLSGLLATYADGNEDVLRDEPHTFTALNLLGEPLSLKCAGETTNGILTSRTTSEQVMHLHFCALKLSGESNKTTIECSNAPNEIETLPEQGTVVEREGKVFMQVPTFRAVGVTCAGFPMTLEGHYECLVRYRTGANVYNVMIHKYDCESSPLLGEQSFAISLGLLSWPEATMEGEQEDRFGEGTTRLVVRTANPEQHSPAVRVLQTPIDHD